MLTEVLARWRGGDDVHLVAPFTPLRELVEGDARTLVLLQRDREALCWAAGLGAGLLLRTVPRADRTKTLMSPLAPRAVVTSLESLRSPVLLREVTENLADVAWLVPRADLFSKLSVGGAGPWVDLLRGACSGGPVLWVHADRSRAPLDAEVHPGRPGALRVVAADAPGPVGPAGRGLVLGPGADGEELGHRLGEVGLARRVHDLHRLQQRPWSQAGAALRQEARGVDALLEAAGAVPGRAVTWLGPIGSPSELATADGSALGVRAPSVETPRTVDAAAVEACRAALAEHSAGDWLAVAGGRSDAPLELLGDLAALGVLEQLRPAHLAARVADQRRFRAPAVNREPRYKALHEAYMSAMRGWSLAERAELALTDRATQDLRKLAVALQWEPAAISDLLVAMNDDSLITAYVEPLGGEHDHQARRGPAWDSPAEEVAGGLADLRAGRAESAARAERVLAAEGCRGRALAEALGVESTEDCGRCDVCDPEDRSWPKSLAGVEAGSAPAPSPSPKLSLDSLFSGLSAAAPVAPPPAKRWSPAQLRDALLSGEEARIEEAVQVAGSRALAWVQAAFQYSGPGGRRGDPTEELAQQLVAFLVGEAGPTPGSDSGGTRARGGAVEVRREGGFGGAHRFVALRGIDGDALAEAVSVGAADDDIVARLVRVRADATRWKRWVRATEEAVSAALDAAPGLPDLSAVIPPSEGDTRSDSPWADASAALALASSGSLDEALEKLPDAPDADRVETILLAALGEWQTVWESAAEALASGTAPADSVGRLEARALLGLEQVPPLAARTAAEWLGWAAEEMPADEARDARIVAAVAEGRAKDFEALVTWSTPATVAALAVAAQALPASLLEHVLETDPVTALSAVRGASPAAVWKRHFAGRSREDQERLASSLDEAAPGFADAGRAWLAQLDEQADLRTRIAQLGEEGRLAEVVPLLARVQAPDEAVRAVAARASEEQKRFTEPLARALTADGFDDDAWSALHAAKEAGWLDPITVLLRAQTRRHPADPRRAAWLARALALAGRWADAERQFGEAGRMADGPPAQAEGEFEGVDLAIEAGENARAAAWLVRMARVGRNRSVARAITMRAWGRKLPEDVARALLDALKADGSGVFAGAVRALQDSLEKGR